jgi:hypothetical protein
MTRGIVCGCLAALASTLAGAAEPPAPTTVLTVDFEDPAAAAALAEGLTITTDPAQVIAGKASLKGDSRGSAGEWNEYLHSRPGLFKAREAYVVTFDYRLLARGSGQTKFYALFRRAANQANHGWWDLDAKPGEIGHAVCDLWTGGAGDWYLILGIEFAGAVAVDNVVIRTDPANRVPEPRWPAPQRTWQSPGGTSYYVDSAAGDDAADGHRPATAWRSLARVNAGTFGPGDQIRLKAGGAWTGFLCPGGGGSDEKPLIIGRYGEGLKPKLDAQGQWQATLLLRNVEHVEARDLDIANTGAQRAPGRCGVAIEAHNAGVVHGVTLRDLEIHDVNGSLVKNEGGGQGIWLNAGDDRGAATHSAFDGVLIEACHLVRCDRNGIIEGGHWARNDWYPSRHVVIRGNRLEDIGGDGIVPLAAEGALVEHNTLHGGRRRCDDYAAGIWPWSCDDTVIQFNEVSGMKGTRDGEGYDSDYNCRNTLIQYNYSHDNDGGFLLICDDGGSKMPWNIGNIGTIARYNLSVNDGERLFHIAGPCSHTQVYNNTVYVGPTRHLPLILPGDWGGFASDTVFANNLFWIAGSLKHSLGKMKQTVFDHNLFFGTIDHLPEGEGNLTVDPQLVNPGAGGDGFEGLVGYKPKVGSPCLGAGRVIELAGARDFWGGTVEADIGAGR